MKRLGLLFFIIPASLLAAPTDIGGRLAKNLLTQIPYTALKAQWYGFSYASPYQDKSFESRYRISMEREDNSQSGFDYKIQADLWGLLPREAQDWVDISQAYVSYHGTDYHFKLGRVLPDWSLVDFYAPSQSIFSDFSIDPLTVQKDGWVGLFSQFANDTWSLELLLSPLFVPSRGGFRFESDSEQFFISSRWGPPLQLRAELGNTSIPLQYQLHIPPLSDILFQLSSAGRVGFQSEFFRASLMATHFVEPEPRLDYDAKMKIVDESSLKGKVALYPDFFHRQLFSLGTAVGKESQELFSEVAWINPNNSDHSANRFRSRQLSTLIGAKLKSSLTLFPNIIVGTKFDKEIDAPPPLTLTQTLRAPHYFSRVEWLPLSSLNFSLFGETNRHFSEGIGHVSLFIAPLEKVEVGTGTDVIFGKEGTYWGQFRSHDRLWIKLRYAI